MSGADTAGARQRRLTQAGAAMLAEVAAGAASA